MKVLVTGGTGFVGRRLATMLAEAGHELRVLSRRPADAVPRLPLSADVRSTPEPGDARGWTEAVAGCQAIVNLAGESIAAGRWTEARKQAIRSSRVDLTRALVGACGAVGAGPAALVSASAVGYYGPRGDEELGEASSPGSDFLARVCFDWEGEALRAEQLGIRVVRARLGLVLGPGGGALGRMALPFRLFIGGPLGSGGQWVSWVHLDDVAAVLRFALEHPKLSGALNVTAPHPRTMRELCRALGAALGRPSWAPVPAFALRLALGEMAEMLLTGQRALPSRALAEGYAFRFPTLEGALCAALAPSLPSGSLRSP